ncbi:MAG: penicillin-binding protein, 1A family [uncultured bacterium]|nr:MAG: penicillin-binding protein, 1A family [uncultured bacterium]OGH13201.1 MAG: hypothetical protein A2687_00680 [Candidatus Levybacteria bacterium RIFCSPHIGHO2_01_FULL_38_26]
MQVLIDVLVFIIRLIINIGDIAVRTFALFLKLLTFLKKRLKIIFLKKKRKRRRQKVVKPIKIFPLPITYKLKYFTAGLLFSLIFIFIPLLFIIFIDELPNPKTLSVQQAPLTTKIYDRNGVLLYQIYASQNRTLVPLSSIPKQLQNATIAIEDKNFYNNSGFDVSAIARAIIANLSGQPLQGGSTITQQLIKSTLLSPEVTIRRKIKEIILALWAQRIYTKGQILEMYLNQVPYGGTAWGIDSAANIYFGKNLKDLTLGENAFLAGLPRAPSIYSPYGETPNAWKKRQLEVLRRMEELNYITSQERRTAEKEKLTFQTPTNSIKAPHFVMHVKDLLVKKYGLSLVEKKGLKVTTSLDLSLQNMASEIVKEEVLKNLYLNLTNGAVLVTNPGNGDILAMVGSIDYTDPKFGSFNVTTSARQPGSSIKIVTYSAALASGFTAATTIDDSPITYNIPGSKPYSPVNYDAKFHGILTLRNAFGNSINVPAVKVLAKVGIPNFVDLGKKMGITTWNNPDEYGLSITLGAAEVKMTDLATVYGVFANNGERVDLNPIIKVEDSLGNVLEEKKDIQRKSVLDPGIAFIISDILSDNPSRAMAFGFNSPLVIPNYTVSVKTGTSDNKRDNWTIGYTKNYLTAVWVGNNDNSPMSPHLASGISGAAPIWNKIMSNLLIDKEDQKPTKPSNVIEKLCLGRIEYFLIGTENSAICISIPSASPTDRRRNI